MTYLQDRHMFMHLPCWSLPKAHKLLAKSQTAEKMLIEPGGYLKVIALASSKGLAVAA